MVSSLPGVPRRWRRVTQVGSPLGLALALAFASHASPAFGPKDYVVQPGVPLPAIERFPACQPERGGQLRVENGPAGRARVTLAVVVLNQRETLVMLEGPGQPRVRERAVKLAASNTMLVWMIGPPGATLGVSVASAGACFEVAITSPTSGASVPEGLALVQGTVHGPGHASVAVNGVPAMVYGTRWAVEIPVDRSVQLLTAVASIIASEAVTVSVPVTVLPEPPGSVELHPDPGDGIAPLTVTWKVVNNTGRALVQYELDLTGGGIFDPPVSRLDGTQVIYSTPGLWFPALRVTDDQGITYTTRATLLANDPASVSARFDALWSGFRSRLQASDVAGALSFLAPVLRPRMEQVFQDLGSSLPAVAGVLGDLHVTDQAGEIAEAIVVQDEPSGRQLYFIQFRRDSLGRWLIEEM